MLDRFRYLDSKLKVAILFFILIIVVAIVWYINNLQYDSKLKVYSIPSSLTMSYDNVKQNITSKTDIKVKHGKYKFTFSADGFEQYTTEIDIKKDKENSVIFALNPLTKEAKNESKRSKYNDIREGIEGKLNKEGAAKLIKDNPIIRNLPINSGNFSIFPCAKYRKTTKTTMGVCIKVTDPFIRPQIDAAFERLKKIDPDVVKKYDIKVNGYIWPTKEEIESNKVIKCGGINNPDWCYTYPDL